MKTHLTPVALAISSVFWMAGPAIGQSLTNRVNGVNAFAKGAPFYLENRTSYGKSGDNTGTQAVSDGDSAQTVSKEEPLVIKDVEISGTAGLAGLNLNDSSGNSFGAGGAGGHGGASVWGSMSVGGNGGTATALAIAPRVMAVMEGWLRAIRW